MTDEPKRITVLGIDPAPYTFGIALIKYHPVGGCKEVIYVDGCVRNPKGTKKRPAEFPFNCEDICYFMDLISGHIDDHGLDAVGIEDGFVGVNAKSGLGVVRVGAWFAQEIYHRWNVEPTMMIHHEWRTLAWGTSRFEKHEVVIDCAMKNMEVLGYKGSEHEAEAIGIAIAAGKKHFER